MKTIYIGVLIFNEKDLQTTKIFTNLEECEKYCQEITEDYIVVYADVNLNKQNLLH